MSILLTEKEIEKAWRKEGENTHNLEIAQIPNHWD